MRRRCLLVMLLALGAAAVLAPELVRAASTQVGSVRAIVGGLSRRPVHRPTAPARTHESLSLSDLLTTQVQQKASLLFVDRSVLHMNQRTQIVLASPTIITLQHGELNAIDTPGSGLRINTGIAAASAIGTNFDVRILRHTLVHGYKQFPPGAEIVSVLTGKVRVTAQKKSRTVNAGQWTQILPGHAPNPPTKHNVAKDLRWAAGLP